MKTPLLVFAAMLCLSACQASAPAPIAPPPVPANAGLRPINAPEAEAGGCNGVVARYRAVQDNDHSTGNIADRIYGQIRQEIEAAQRACDQGRDREAQAMIASSRARHGYPNRL